MLSLSVLRLDELVQAQVRESKVPRYPYGSRYAYESPHTACDELGANDIQQTGECEQTGEDHTESPLVDAASDTVHRQHITEHGKQTQYSVMRLPGIARTISEW